MTQMISLPPLQCPDGTTSDRREMLAFGETLSDLLRRHQIEQGRRVEEKERMVVSFLGILASNYNREVTLYNLHSSDELLHPLTLYTDDWTDAQF